MNTQKLIGDAIGVARAVVKIGVGAAAEGIDVIQRARQGGATAKPGMDDATLARTVETELLRGADAPKGTVDVRAVDGVVELRGEVEHPEDVRVLEARARAVPEVRDVQNLLHLPKTPSRTRADTPRRQQQASTTRRKTAAAPRSGAKRTTAETPAKPQAPTAEPAPAEHAEEGSGRTPAPMGSAEEPEPPKRRSPAGSPRPRT